MEKVDWRACDVGSAGASTVADMLKFRRRLGLDSASEAVRRYREHEFFDVDELLHYARICRVGEVLTPYLEALL